MLDFDLIETPENVELQRRLAGIGSRFIAGFIDNLLIGLVSLVFGIILLIAGAFANFSFPDFAMSWIWAFYIVLGFIFYWGYFMLFEFATNGKTPGKKYMKIRVVQKEGQGVTFTSIAIRNLLRVVDSIGGYAVAGLSMFITKRMQRLGDLAAGTVVISEQVANYAAEYDKKTNVVADRSISPQALDASGLTVEQFNMIQNYWSRRDELNIEARNRILPRLIVPVLERLGLSSEGKSFEDLEEFVEKIINNAMTYDSSSLTDDTGTGAKQ